MKGDSKRESNETFNLDLSVPTNVLLPDRRAVATITNDDSTLTYRLLKGFSNTTIATWTATSTPWDRPWLHYTDTAVTPPSTAAAPTS